jgi:hypothetical protein
MHYIEIKQNIYKFERNRFGGRKFSQYGSEYGNYLYRNIYTNELISSWNPPKNEINSMYNEVDIGLNTNALTYYKNN